MYRVVFLWYFIMISVASLNAQGFICAVGGGSENYGDWSDAPYRWIVEKSNYGKVIVLSVNDETTWIPDYFISFGASSAVNKKINTRAIADNQATYDEIVSARAVFIKGGDQWNYVNLWKGTKTEAAVLAVYRNGGVIAGTSAGAMVLGGIDFTAQLASPTSREALTSPFASSITLDTSFLSLQPNVLFDTHVAERARQGRLIAFMMNAKAKFNKSIIGVGIDDRTAICIDSLGIGTVMGSGATAVFYTDSLGSIGGVSPGVFRLRCDQLIRDWKFNFRTKSIHSIPQSAGYVSLSGNAVETLRYNYFSGNNSLSNNLAIENLRNEPGPVTILTHIGALAKAEIIKSRFAGKKVTVIPISSSTVNNGYYKDSLRAGMNVVVYADSITPMLALSDTTTILGAEFSRNKLSYVMCWVGIASRLIGELTVNNIDTDPLASYRGKMTVSAGWNVQPKLFIHANVYESSDYVENRYSAMLYNLFKAGRGTALLLDGADYLPSLYYRYFTQYGGLPLFAVESSRSTRKDSSVYRASSSIGPRQIIGMDNLRYTLIYNAGASYTYPDGNIAILDNINGREKEITSESYTVFPTPWKDEAGLTISGLPNTSFTWGLYSISGELIDSGNETASSEKNVISSVTLTLRPPPAGVYIIRIMFDDGKIVPLKIIKL